MRVSLSVLFVSQTNVFKQRMVAAKEIVDSLPGGEMSLSDQDEVIAMLKALRDQKRFVHDFLLFMYYSTNVVSSFRRRLAEFSRQQAITSTSTADTTMEEGA